MLNHLLIDGGGVLAVEHDTDAGSLTVKVDRSRMSSHGKPSLGRLLCRIHIWRRTADVESCQKDCEASTDVAAGEHEEWSRLVAGKPEPRWKFVHANTFLRDGQVTMKEYEAQQ